MYNVTMQNHSPFLSGKVSGGYKLGYKGNLKEANEYMNLVSHSDAAAKKLLNYFKKVNEKTVVLFFGDHQPCHLAVILICKAVQRIKYAFGDIVDVSVAPERHDLALLRLGAFFL